MSELSHYQRLIIITAFHDMENDYPFPLYTDDFWSHFRSGLAVSKDTDIKILLPVSVEELRVWVSEMLRMGPDLLTDEERYFEEHGVDYHEDDAPPIEDEDEDEDEDDCGDYYDEE